MGTRNDLIEGVSGAGTNVSPQVRHAHQRRDAALVRQLAARQDDDITFLRGSSRNVVAFLGGFDGVVDTILRHVHAHMAR